MQRVAEALGQAAIESAAVSDTGVKRSGLGEGRCEKRHGEAAPKRPDARHWAMVLPASHCSIAVWHHQSGTKPWATARCAELDDGKLQAIVRALRGILVPPMKQQNVPSP
ncbi:hypothetical protein SBA3_10017 [Candidatus Sulfopaludibacter sp. SbA3]|nr:hypothetical protein SBA3_10017 [Candidatus Sulfopaludibacter sp. SbA3]